MKSVAVVGLGAMGSPMVHRLLSGGFELTVYDTREEALSPFAGLARIANEPRDCADADVVLIVVATGEQAKQVVEGPNGLTGGITNETAGFTSETSPLVVVMSTVGRHTVVGLHEALGAIGVPMIEAPISGGALRAREGTLSVLMGGDPGDIDRARPVFERLGSNLFYCGPIGSAQVVKIANNVLGNLNTLASAEVYRLILEQGLSLHDATRIFEASSGRNWLSATPGEAAKAYATLTATPFDMTTAIIRKDVGLAAELASHSEGSYPVIEALASLVVSLGDETLQNWRIIADASMDQQ